MDESITKQDPYICYLQETHFRSKDTHRPKVEEWEKMFHENGNKNEAILIPDKIDFKTESI